jgi:hypothetical protein
MARLERSGVDLPILMLLVVVAIRGMLSIARLEPTSRIGETISIVVLLPNQLYSSLYFEYPNTYSFIVVPFVRAEKLPLGIESSLVLCR